MLAAVWYAPNDVRLEEREVPRILPGTLLIKVKACAICGSDLRIFREGNSRVEPSRILGHEIAGEVVEVGAGVMNYSVGDSVSTGADIPCGECSHCLSGRPNCCDINYAIGYQFDGGYAEYIRLDPLVVKNGPLQKFNAVLPWQNAALAEPLACCINGYERALYHKGMGGSVVIFGAGPIGLMLLMLGKQYYGVDNVVVIEPSETRRNLALAFGADLVIDPDITQSVDEVMAFTENQGAQVVFTACPILETHNLAVQMVAKRGVVNFFGGLPKTAPAIDILSNFLHYREAYITGSHGSTPAQHKRALDLIATGIVDVSKVVSKTVGLKDIHKGFDLARSGTVAKVVITPDDALIT